MGTTEPFQIRDTYIRVDTMADTYAEIAEEAFGQFLSEMANPVPRPELRHDYAAYDEHVKRKSVAGIKTIVFSAMALEAAVFDLAAIQLSDKVATDYLDKMDLLGKWMIVPSGLSG